ncbi:MAG TPA: SH3 domain-containing protein [Candidatus Brocadiia bacterium]|nr:SH3 domain-containing protein [Candidatus Brocadiia bacterium]
MQCKECGMEVSQDQTKDGVCAPCSQKVEPSSGREGTSKLVEKSKPKTKTPPKQTLVILVGITVFCLIIGAMVGPQQAGGTRLRSGDSMAKIGDVCILSTSGMNSTFVFATHAARDDFDKAVIAHDKYGMEDLFLSGAVFSVANGTRARVIDASVWYSKVRIEGDTYTGRTGWVSKELARRP